MMRTGANEQIGNQTAALFMIGTDRGDALPQHTVERNDRAMNGRPIIRRMRGMGAHYDAVHDMPAQHFHIFGFAVLGICGGAQHGAQSLPGEHMLQAGRERGEEGMPDGRHDHTNHIGAVVI